ncbi:MAG TPA: hypothetical protein VFB63_04435 [Bryobacteraceae bacterium]|jgi:hypothetical protein|nr:hypothetical protein [Bryobacteraceae bacterium]
MKRIRNFSLVVLAAASMASAAPSIGPSHFVNYASPETFLSDALSAATPTGAEMPSPALMASGLVLVILMVKAAGE